MDYSALVRIQDALEAIRRGELDTLECGRHELFEHVFVNVSEYQTKKTSLFEAHRQYIDIQYIISGEELIEVADVSTLAVTRDYDEASDAVLGNASGKRYLLKQGQTIVLLPQEAHMPGLSNGADCMVKKAVVKVPVGNPEG